MSTKIRWLPYLRSAFVLSIVGILLAEAKGQQPSGSGDPLAVFAAELVEIRPGEGPFPESTVLPKTFRIARHEVPQNLYAHVQGSDPSRWKGPRNSSEMMTWNEARAFCEKLTGMLIERKLIPADSVVRLPTEAEWEYCCRAGTTTRYSFGDEAQQPGDQGNKATRLDEFAWHTGNAAGNDPPVGALKPNAWGLHDMHGYLWEMTSDKWSKAEADNVDVPENAIVARGGSWKDRFDRLTSTSRKPIGPEERDDSLGFRCVVAPAKK
ncbi:MAG: formylglycine-generating enzyme family protein [Planctomycetaceae bacterium]|nr:formylglycine-generating enzyme family protein [Planctomycetaceae bacterium]